MALRSIGLKPTSSKNTKPRTHAIRGSEPEHFGQFYSDKPERVHEIMLPPAGIVVKTSSSALTPYEEPRVWCNRYCFQLK